MRGAPEATHVLNRETGGLSAKEDLFILKEEQEDATADVPPGDSLAVSEAKSP